MRMGWTHHWRWLLREVTLHLNRILWLRVGNNMRLHLHWILLRNPSLHLWVILRQQKGVMTCHCLRGWILQLRLEISIQVLVGKRRVELGMMLRLSRQLSLQK